MSHSYLKNTPEVGKKTALKLINKYADSFNIIKEENKQLKIQIENLNFNLKLNKSIIENFYSKLNSKERDSTINSKFQQENLNLYNQNEELRKIIEELNSKIIINQHNYFESTTQIKEENEHLKTKIFMLEQVIQKKDNIINHNKAKMNLYKEGVVFNQKEIYVTNPSKIINEINNELLTYKELNEKNNKIIKDTRTVLEKYEKQIIELQNENQIIRQEYKNLIFNSNMERETLMAIIQKERFPLRSITADNPKSRRNNNNSYEVKNKGKSSNKIRNNNFRDINKNISENDLIILNKDNFIKENNINDNYFNLESCKLKSTDDEYNNDELPMIYKDDFFLEEIENKQYEHEDFLEILKKVGLSLEKYEELTKVKIFSKFTEIIELILNLLKEKEKIINILQAENNNLNSKNFKLNKDNMFLFNQNINLKKVLTELDDNINNNSNSQKKIFINKNTLNKINEMKLNPKIKDSMHYYREYLNINQKGNRLITDDILNIKKVIIESSLDMESSTLKKKFEKEKEKIMSNKKLKKKKESENLNKIEQNNLFVKPILEKNDEILNNNNANNNLLLEQEKEKIEELNKSDDTDNIKNKKINNSNKKNISNKYKGTIISVTSSEFRDDCPGFDSFLSTIKFEETKKNY